MKESGNYLDLKNHANYIVVIFLQVVNDSKITAIQAQNNINPEVIVNQLQVTSVNAKIKIKGQNGGTFDIKISSISILHSVSLYLENIEYSDLNIYMYQDFQHSITTDIY